MSCEEISGVEPGSTRIKADERSEGSSAFLGWGDAGGSRMQRSTTYCAGERRRGSKYVTVEFLIEITPKSVLIKLL